MTVSLNIGVITSGLSPIVEPLLKSQHRIIALIDSAPRGMEADSDNAVKVIKKSKLRKKAEEKNIEYYFVTRRTVNELVEILQGRQIDVLIVFSMSFLLPQSILEIPRYGVINLHPSLLPAYRGPNSFFWMLYNNEKTGGVTAHFLDAGEDTGPILGSVEIAIPRGATYSELLQIFAGTYGAPLIINILDNLPKYRQTKIQQPEISPTERACNLCDEEHGSMVDWENWSVERIWHLMRGTQDWFNAVEPPTGLFQGMRWVVHRFEYCRTDNFQKGRVYRVLPGYHFVCASDGKIILRHTFNPLIWIKQFIGIIGNPNGG